MTNRELFKEALAKVKALNGTAEDKADLFEQEAERIRLITKGTWSAQRLVGTKGEHVFAGRVGELLVIDSNAKLYRGRIVEAVISFIPPNIVELDYNHLTLIP